MLVLYGFLAFHLVSGFTVMNVTRSNETRTNGEWVPCGQDQLEGRTIEEGMTEIENFPWLGLLVYPINGDNPTTTAVVLISDDVVLSSALDIDYYNKENFRALSRVVLGNNCTGPYISIREYTFHPEFTRSTYSTLALVQLAIDINAMKLIPICPPPSTFMNSEEIFAMTLVNDCYNSSMVNIFKMDYMDATQCQDYYRRAGLDIQSMWPTHLACAQGQVGGHCIWRSGATLVIRHEGQWKLLGIGVYGPGCESPSRFLDYGMYHLWVKRITSKIGQPTISRIANNYVVLRRSTSNIQRFGLCDAEETTKGIYADSATMLAPHDEYDEVDPVITAYYNVTLLENVDYHCIIFQAKKELSIPGTPLIKLRRVCPDEDNSCTNSTGRILRYYAVIKFKHICTFSVNAYGVYLATNETDTDEET